MRVSVKIDALADEIKNALEDYSQEKTELVKSTCKKASSEATKELRQTSPKKSGAYAKGWAAKTQYESSQSVRITVYNKDHYRLTHLLEKGHAGPYQRGRTKAQVHIEPVEQRAVEKVLAAIERGD